MYMCINTCFNFGVFGTCILFRQLATSTRVSTQQQTVSPEILPIQKVGEILVKIDQYLLHVPVSYVI